MKNKTFPFAAVFFAATALSGFVGGAGSAWAQTASQITQPNYAPPVIRPVTGGMNLPQTAGNEAPEGAENLKVTPSGLSLSGDVPPGVEAETARIEAGLSGKRVTGADLFAAARDLEQAYARAGYPLVRVSLPPQTITDGAPLKLVITDGTVAGVDTSALPERARRRVEAVMEPLVGQSSLTQADLERRLLLAGDTPGVALRSTLRAGDAPGTAEIVVDGRYDPVTATLGVDNGLDDDLGNYAVNLGVNFNNLLSMGEVGYLMMAGYPGFNDSIFESEPRNRQLVAGFRVPIGINGVWLNVEGVDARTNPVSDFDYTIPDHYQRLSTRLGYNWIRSRNLNTESVLSFDITDEKQTLDVAGEKFDWAEDRLRIVRLAQSVDYYMPSGGFISGDATLSFGIDGLGARQPTLELPMTRAGAEPGFQKFNLSGRFSQQFFGDQLGFSLAAKAQTSFGQAMAASEQMGLGGMNWLSGYGSGDIQSDTGAALRAEFAFPGLVDPFRIGGPVNAALEPYIFGAAGIAGLEEPTALEARTTRATSVGIGVRLGLAEVASISSANLMLEYAHGTASDNNIGTTNRFNFRFESQF